MKSVWPVATLKETEPLLNACWLMAPASKQPVQPAVLLSVLPEAVALTALIHDTALPPLGGVVPVGVVALPVFSGRIVVSFFAAPGALLAYVTGDSTI